MNSRRVNGINCHVLLITNVNDDAGRLTFRRDGCGVWMQRNTKIALPISSRSRAVTSGRPDFFLWRTTFQCKSCPTLRKTEIYMRKNNSGELMLFDYQLFESGNLRSTLIMLSLNSIYFLFTNETHLQDCEWSQVVTKAERKILL